MLYTRGLLSSAAGVVEQSASGKAIGVDELQKVMNSSASDKQKTSFFIQYLLSQREWLLDFAKTLLIAVIVFHLFRYGFIECCKGFIQCIDSVVFQNRAIPVMLHVHQKFRNLLRGFRIDKQVCIIRHRFLCRHRAVKILIRPEDLVDVIMDTLGIGDRTDGIRL